jgi:hypothetical protein
MRKTKSVFKFDYQLDEAAEYYNDLLFEAGKSRKEAKEETRKKYGFYTIYITAATMENAIKKFEREYQDEVNNRGCTWLDIETVICGNVI